MDSQPMVEIIGIGISAVAGVVTAWMAVETRRMATAAKKALDLEQAPVLGVRDLRVEVGVVEQGAALKSVRVGMELFNAGRVLVRYTMKTFEVGFAASTTNTPRFVSRGGRVLPGSSTVFWYPGLLLDPPVSAFPAEGRAKFAFEYSDEAGNQSRSVLETIQYWVSPGASGWHVTWLYVDEPPAA